MSIYGWLFSTHSDNSDVVHIIADHIHGWLEYSPGKNSMAIHA